MQFRVDRGPLLEAVGRVQSAAASGKTVPILGMVLLQVAGNAVTVRATDTIVEASTEAICTGLRQGEICAPVGQLHDLLRSLPEGAEVLVSLEPGATQLAVTAGRSRFKLPIMPGVSFPDPPEARDGEVIGEIAAKDLARLIDKAAFAMANGDSRTVFNGLHLHVVDSPAGRMLRAVATNGHALALASVPCPPALDALPAITLASRLTGEVRRWLGDLAAPVELRVDPSRLQLHVGAGRVGGPLLAGAYADYQRVIPEDPPHRAIVDLALFKAAVKRSVLATEGKTRAVRVELSPGQLGFLGRSAERGEAQEEVEAAYDGPVLSIPFNSANLLEFAERISGPTIELALSGPADPVKVLDPKDPDLVLVTMPLRV